MDQVALPNILASAEPDPAHPAAVQHVCEVPLQDLRPHSVLMGECTDLGTRPMGQVLYVHQSGGKERGVSGEGSYGRTRMVNAAQTRCRRIL